MIRSMTGYGRAEGLRLGRKIVVEIRSVNNRYLDQTVKLPRSYYFAEEAIRALVKKKAARGKVELYYSFDVVDAQTQTVRVNHAVARGYLEALRELRDTYELRDDITAMAVSRLNEVLVTERSEDEPEALLDAILELTEEALDRFNEMRAVEGEKLAADIRLKAEGISEMVTRVEARVPFVTAEYRARLSARMEDVLKDVRVDESRILTEAAIFADRTAVDEETVRLRSHLAQLDTMLREGGSIGRKLDFLIQEVNREVNTIGSKGNDIEITNLVVDLKAEIEKIREQVQNIE